jgi:hypothetical protein
MKKLGLFAFTLTLLPLFLLPAGCGLKGKLDREAFLAVNAYVEEIVQAVSAALFDLDVWARDMSDQERIEWLEERKETLLWISREHLDHNFPSYEEMANWTVPVKRGEAEWIIEGEALTAAVKEMISASEALVEVLELIVNARGDLSEAELESVELVKSKARTATSNINSLFFRS